MLKKYYPCEYVESVFVIDYCKLLSLGYKGIIFDIDNTLVPHGKDSTPEVDELFRNIHKLGLKTVLLSNNDDRRIERFIQNIDTPYISEANKPDTKGFLEAVKMLGINKSEAVVIGDTTFTDIVGANLSGIDNILVKFIRQKSERWIGFKRILEKFILLSYKLRIGKRHEIGDILITEE